MEKSYTKFWKNIAVSKTATSTDVIMHCALKAFFAKNKKEVSRADIFKALITRSFTPISRESRLKNGATKWDAIRISFINSKWWDWDTLKWQHILGLNRAEAIKQIFNGSESEFKRFGEFHKFLASDFTKTEKNLSKRYYTYIFVDQDDVEPIYQAVQASHVAMVIGQKMNKSLNSSNVYFQVCKKPLDLTLNELVAKLNNNGFQVEEFYEPDVNRTIAIGTHPVVSHKRGILLNSELLSF